jgi:hypothetical protein
MFPVGSVVIGSGLRSPSLWGHFEEGSIPEF